jgi:hypothetical protein
MMNTTDTLKLALAALEDVDGANQLGWWARSKAITAIKQALNTATPLAAPTVQEPVAHCEAGPEFCPVCWAETRSLALAAAVVYIQRNTPTLVWTEICRALDKSSPAAQPAPVPLTDDARGLLVVEHLGPNALLHKPMSIYDAFHMGIDAAEAAHGITKGQP